MQIDGHFIFLKLIIQIVKIMKILRPGNIPFEYVKINCQYCDCEFIAHKETEVEHIYDQIDRWR